MKVRKLVLHANLFSALLMLSEWRRAEAEIRRAMELEPENRDYKSGLKNLFNAEGNALVSAADYKAAIEKYEAAIAVDSKDPVVYENLAGAWEWMAAPDSHEQMITALRKAQELAPDEAKYSQKLAELEKLPIKQETS